MFIQDDGFEIRLELGGRSLNRESTASAWRSFTRVCINALILLKDWTKVHMSEVEAGKVEKVLN